MITVSNVLTLEKDNTRPIYIHNGINMKTFFTQERAYAMYANREVVRTTKVDRNGKECLCIHISLNEISPIDGSIRVVPLTLKSALHNHHTEEDVLYIDYTEGGIEFYKGKISAKMAIKEYGHILIDKIDTITIDEVVIPAITLSGRLPNIIDEDMIDYNQIGIKDTTPILVKNKHGISSFMTMDTLIKMYKGTPIKYMGNIKYIEL